jgi:hypothetical protein
VEELIIYHSDMINGGFARSLHVVVGIDEQVFYTACQNLQLEEGPGFFS